jgi:hypothetical protein
LPTLPRENDAASALSCRYSQSFLVLFSKKNTLSLPACDHPMRKFALHGAALRFMPPLDLAPAAGIVNLT